MNEEEISQYVDRVLQHLDEETVVALYFVVMLCLYVFPSQVLKKHDSPISVQVYLDVEAGLSFPRHVVCCTISCK